MAMSSAHKSQAKAMGLNDAQVADLEARGIDWQKFLQNLPQLIMLIVSLFGQNPTPPGPAPVQQ